MSKELIVSLNGREKKIAIIEDDVVTEFYVERGDENQGIVGNIYKGRVMKVLPGMQSAFVDIGLERDAFLYVSDFLDDEDYDGAFQDEKKDDKRGPRPERNDRGDRQRNDRRPTPTPTPVTAGDSADSAEGDDLVDEAAMEALSHIEELSEEPVIEHAPDDETPTPPPARETARDRRRGRLHFVEPETEATEEAVEAAAPATEEQAESREEPAGRNRRRRGRGRDKDRPRGFSDEAAPSEAAEPAAEPEAKAAPEPVEVKEPEPKPRRRRQVQLEALVQSGEPMERVSDDDLAPVSRKTKAQPEEVVIGKLEVEPTPSARVGSIKAGVPVATDFERVSDDEPKSDESLKDASAEVREENPRAEFATRRGGRGRRRRKPNEEGSSSEEQDSKSSETPAADSETAESGETFLSSRAPLPARPARPVITDLLREGQEVLVQIAKEPIGQKGARITSHIVLPGRYVVYMPTVDHIGVSRKIGTDEERQRLKRTLNQLRAESNAPGGYIVRTAAGGRTTEELRDDVGYLARTWSDIRRRSDKAKAPSVVHRDLDLVQRILRDQLSSDFTAIRVDNEFEYERILDFVNRFAPKLINRVKLYTKDTPILEEYGIQAEVDKAVKPRVWLKSGGYIVINQTEALVAIDVNTGKFVGRSNRLEDTIVKTNLEAAKEIARQIRLRDLGGIIILDFIDMEERRNRQRVMQALEQELRHDKSPSKILQFNDFGLVAITRKRVKQSLERTLCAPCSYCGGGGMVKSAQTVCYELLAEVRRVAKHNDNPNEVVLRLNPEVAKALRSTERDLFHEIESHFNGVVTIKSDPAIHQEQYDIALM